MQSSWAEEHSRALREYLERGLSFSQIANAINARFNTVYSRNATIGRARRMGFSGPARADKPVRPKLRPKRLPARLLKMRARVLAGPRLKPAVLKRAAALKLRCVGIVPRHLSLVDLEPGDCRYPYGGDKEGEAITFCGHPRRDGSSYCVAHFHLTSAPDTASNASPARSRCGSWRPHEHEGRGHRRPDEAAFAAASPGAFARAGPARAGRLGPQARACCAVAQSVGGDAGKRKPQPVKRAP